VKTGSWPFKTDMSEALLEKGFAEVYRGGGAQYAGNENRLKGLEKEARASRRGMWSQKRYESPAEYKRKMRQLANDKEKDRVELAKASHG